MRLTRPAHTSYERAMPVAGMLHIVSNCTDSLHHGVFQHWKKFLEQLDAVCNLLCQPHTQELYLQRCVRSCNLHRFEHLLSQKFHKFIDRRWSSLTTTLSWLLPLENALRATWNAGRFLRGCDEKTHAEHKLHTLTLAIPDSFFWAYGHMMLSIQVALDALAFWSENCPCHEGFTKKEANLLVGTMREQAPMTDVWQALMPNRNMKNSLWASCPMRGKRAPELAVGVLQERMDEVACH